jgi:hypothetical protein
MTAEQSSLIQALTMAFGGGSATPSQQVAQQIMQPAFQLPYGVDERRETPKGVIFVGKDVNDLVSWDDHVQCDNGGTYDGIKVLFIGCKKTNRSDKSFSSRDGWICRFEICKPGGRNPMNEVVNIFVKHENDYKPYLDPARWSAKKVAIEFKSEEPGEKPREMRVNMIYFDNELISDQVERKAKHILERLDGMYTCYIDGKAQDFDEE